MENLKDKWDFKKSSKKDKIISVKRKLLHLYLILNADTVYAISPW